MPPGGGGFLAQQRQHLRHVGRIGQADFAKTLFEIVIPVRQTQPPLREIKGVERTVLGVRLNGFREKAADAALMKVGQQPQDVIAGCQRRNAPEVGLQRFEGQRLQPVGVQRRAVEIAHLPGRRVFLDRRVRGEGIQDFVDEEPIPLLQLHERAPARFVLRHGVGLDPVAGGVMEEVRTRIDRPVHVIDGKPRRPRRRLGGTHSIHPACRAGSRQRQSETTIKLLHVIVLHLTGIRGEKFILRQKSAEAGL